eukprot:230612-Rhodomonas_salina.1
MAQNKMARRCQWTWIMILLQSMPYGLAQRLILRRPREPIPRAPVVGQDRHSVAHLNVSQF